MSITAGAVVRAGQRFFVVVTMTDAALVLAPVFPCRRPSLAGDVRIDHWHAAFCASASISTRTGLEPVARISDVALRECQRAAQRCTLTSAIVAKFGATRAWAVEAANERSAVR